MKLTFGGLRVRVTPVTQILAEQEREEDRQLICVIPTNQEATLERARREAIALIRSGDLNARVWVPVQRVYICVNRFKEPAGVVGYRYYCLTDAIVAFFGGPEHFRAGEILEVYPPPLEPPPCQKPPKNPPEHGPEPRQKTRPRPRKTKGSKNDSGTTRTQRTPSSRSRGKTK